MKKWINTLKVTAMTSIAVASGFLMISSPNASIDHLPTEVERLPLPVPSFDLKQIQASIQEQTGQSNESEWTEHALTIRPNDSLSIALDRIGVSHQTTYDLTQLPDAKKLTTLRVGDELKVWLDDDKQLQKLVYPKSQTLSYEVSNDNGSFTLNELKADVESVTSFAVGKIEGSFYMAAQNAGLSPKSIMKLADLFAWDIDFIRELRDNDQFKVIFEKQYIDGEYIGDGEILAAEITTYNGAGKHRAFLMRTDDNKIIGYYDEHGKSLRKAFLRNPVDVVRITSKFNPRRFHPVLKEWKAHRGVDYGGPIGTPVRATGKGQIVMRGWGNGYGNVVKIQHANNYMTVYGHFSKFGKFKRGDYVNQGDIIGYIGMTGRATGPHLHYEFRVAGKHVDPLGLKFAADGPIPDKYKAEYLKRTGGMLSQFERFQLDSQIAANFE